MADQVTECSRDATRVAMAAAAARSGRRRPLAVRCKHSCFQGDVAVNFKFPSTPVCCNHGQGHRKAVGATFILPPPLVCRSPCLVMQRGNDLPGDGAPPFGMPNC